MPTIVVASPKGGCGKSTTAVLLGTELARAGADVFFLDCDPNRSLTLWATKGVLPPRVTVQCGIDDTNIMQAIRDRESRDRFVIVDLEGIAARIISRAISQADLVITPMRATALDATVGVQTVALIAQQEKILERKIRHVVVFTMTRGPLTKQHREIEMSLREQGISVITPPLVERAAFAALFAFGGDLSTIPEQGVMEKAFQNARDFCQAILNKLKEIEHGKEKPANNQNRPKRLRSVRQKRQSRDSAQTGYCR